MISAILRVAVLCVFGLGLRIGVNVMLRNLSCWNPNVDLMVSALLWFHLDSCSRSVVLNSLAGNAT